MKDITAGVFAEDARTGHLLADFDSTLEVVVGGVLLVGAKRDAKVLVEVRANRGEPLKAPAESLLVGLESRQWRRRDRHHADVAGREVLGDAVEVVRPKRAAWTPFVPIGAEHEVVDGELALVAKKLRERLCAVWSFERIALLDLDRRELASLGAQCISRAG